VSHGLINKNGINFMIIRDRVRQSNVSYKPKKYIFPEGFKLLVDTREQRPLFRNISSKHPEYFSFTTLKNGDYSIKGFENKFAIERKQLSDFYSYISSERNTQYKNKKERKDKTKEKLTRLASFDFAGLVIESELSDILLPQVYNDTSPEVARGFLASVNIRYGIHVFTSRRRGRIEQWIMDRAIKYFNIMKEI
jgi:ERCC4-type nuclease